MSLQVDALEQSFATVAPHGDKLTQVFYRRLFDDFPEVRQLFANTTMSEQEKKLLASLKLVIENLRRPEVLAPALEQLGKRHVGYGAQAAHYPAVGSTLLKSLAEVAGDQWTNELEQAWTEAYGVISQIMLTSASTVVGSTTRTPACTP
jgi:hemoglobin-like flavoprotein